MNLKTGELHIWRYMLDENDYQEEKLHPILSEQEQKRCDEYLHEAEKVRYTCNHRFVRKVLATYMNIQPSAVSFSHAPLGKPYIKDSDLFFNYSYRTTFGLLAITKQAEIGVDIERMKTLQDTPTFAQFSFSEQERNLIFKSEKNLLQDTLFTFWTFKEAIIKALGVGLNADLTQIDLSEFLYREFNPLAYDHHTNYTIKQIPALEGYKAAFAIKGTIKNYKEFIFKDLDQKINFVKDSSVLSSKQNI